MTHLPLHAHTLSDLPGGWCQVSLTLSAPWVLEPGSRLQWGDCRLAPWRANGTQLDCLCPQRPSGTDGLLPQLIKQGHPLGHLPANTPLLLAGSGLGMADVLLAASHLRTHAMHCLILLAADHFPFQPKPARIMVPALPQLIAANPLLEDWGFANRLISPNGLPGCFDGTLDELLAGTPALHSLTSFIWQD